jgi:type I restriction enzyme S subunit
MPDIEQLRVPLPELPVQDAVADFLDAETARIDTLIAKKRRMLELLRRSAPPSPAKPLRRGST